MPFAQFFANQRHDPEKTVNYVFIHIVELYQNCTNGFTRSGVLKTCAIRRGGPNFVFFDTCSEISCA